MPASIFQIGQRVDRIEDREVTEATVIQIIERDDGSSRRTVAIPFPEFINFPCI